MKVTEFSSETKVDHVTPPWNQYLKEGDFISYMPSYTGNQFLDSFVECSYPCKELGDITYYAYDPVSAGMPADKKYPLVVFLHGATNALDGKICVSHSGAEMFASEKYQEDMGGAYLLVPLANEKKNDEGNLYDSWSEAYVNHIATIIKDYVSKHSDTIGPIIVGGGSSGGYMTWEMLKAYPDLFAGAFPVSGFSDGMLACLGKGKKIFVACAVHDEFKTFADVNESELKAFADDPDVICYFPELLRNGDGGVASLYFGIEMGQHCMITQIQANLLYDDGSAYVKELPHGMTGWIKTFAE